MSRVNTAYDLGVSSNLRRLDTLENALKIADDTDMPLVVRLLAECLIRLRHIEEKLGSTR
jgi:hypothetical protein